MHVQAQEDEDDENNDDDNEVEGDDDNEVEGDDEMNNEEVENKPDDTVEKESEESVKCELCMFEITDKKRFTRHTIEKHSSKGKYVCMGCKEEFNTRTKFNNHKYFGCS